MRQFIDEPSTEDKGLVSKPPNNKPAPNWAKTAFTFLMWSMSLIGTLDRFIGLVQRFIRWVREMSDDS